MILEGTEERRALSVRPFSIILKVLMSLCAFLYYLMFIFVPAWSAVADALVVDRPDAEKEMNLLSREPDPVILAGGDLSGIAGTHTELLGLWALRDNRLIPIPFQVDHKDETGKYILTVVSSKEERSPTALDDNDEVIFMAKDLGTRCAPDRFPPGWQRGAEIEALDPTNGTRGWCYLFSFEQPPEKSRTTYTRYQFAHTGRDIVDTDAFTMVFPPVDQSRAHSCRELRIPVMAGGSGENFLDRLKTRVRIKFLFSLLGMNLSEDTMRSELLAYKEGPVRVIRRFKLFIPLGFGLKSPGFVTDSYYYETVMSAPMEFTIPCKFGHVVSSVTMRIGFDYLPVVMGSRFFNSVNLQGFVVDGKLAPDEEKMIHGEAVWNLLNGPMGTVMRRNLKIGLSREYFNIEEYVWDQVAEADLPEGSPGNLGHSYQLWDVTDLPRGRYHLEQYFFVVPNFEWGDQHSYLRIHDDPLQVTARPLDLRPP